MSRVRNGSRNNLRSGGDGGGGEANATWENRAGGSNATWGTQKRASGSRAGGMLSLLKSPVGSSKAVRKVYASSNDVRDLATRGNVMFDDFDRQSMHSVDSLDFDDLLPEKVDEEEDSTEIGKDALAF